MSLVIDASVAIKWVIPEEHSNVARALRTEVLIAPAIWTAEVGNVLWRHVVHGEIGPEEAVYFLSRLRAAPVMIADLDSDIEAALSLAVELNHPIYDCLYLALALRENTHVVTADKRFVALASKRAHLKGRVRALA